MNRTARMLYVDAPDVLLKGRMAEIAVARDWELRREVARLAQQDAPPELASSDLALYETWRVDAVRQKAIDLQRSKNVA